MLATVPATRAQESFPWAKFVDLTERKGHKDVRLHAACRHLGLLTIEFRSHGFREGQQFMRSEPARLTGKLKRKQCVPWEEFM
jgi:hypothetical protein